MLIDFKFRNYRSFRDEVSLSFVAKKVTELQSHIAYIGKERFLKLAVIYGANASGKSNLFKAFDFMSVYVIDSFKFGGDNKLSSDEENLEIKVTPFLFDEYSKEIDSSFEVVYSYPGDATNNIYKYGFSIKGNIITAEWLSYKSKGSRTFKDIFKRDGEKIEFNKAISKWEENIRISLEPETLISSLGAKLKIPELKAIRDWFYNNEVIAFGDPTEAFFRSRLIPNGFIDDILVQNKVADFFNSFGNNIKGFSVEKVSDDTAKEDRYKIDTKHGEGYTIPLSEESSGTLKMFQLYPVLKNVLEEGSVLFIDELNEKLHPILVRSLINTFTSDEKNPKNAQLIFTTHDSWQLSNDILRRDEIWFVHKNIDETSSLYSLSQVLVNSGAKIRKDENYEKNYYSGKYGAIPNIEILDV